MPETMKMFFPRFLWLLRDVHLAITDKEGKKITPTEFLHTRILASECGEPTELGSSLCSLFPSLECCTLPVPSIKKEVIRNIVEQEDKLKPAFHTSVNELIQQILQQVAPKKAIDGVSLVNGSTFASLACGYVEAINTPGALPNLEQGGQAVIRLQIKEYTDKLVREYEREMEESLKGILPLEERNLMRIHEQKLKRKRDELQQEVCRINPLNSSKEDVDPLVSELEQEIIKWSKPDDGAKREVVGGVLFQFTTQNYSKSKQHCEEPFGKLVEHFKLKDKVAEAVQSSKTLEIKKEIQAITHHYNMVAVGPASSEVREKGLMELNQLGKTLKMIPGCPQDVKLIGRGPDRIKLSWEPPLHNPEAAEVYFVSMRVEGGAWEDVKRTKHTKALITGLKSKKKYEFKVMAANKTLISLANEKKSETEWSKAFWAAGGFATGVVCAPFVTVGMLTCLVVEEIKNGSETTRTNSVEEIEAKVVEGIKCGSGTTTTTSVEEIEEIEDKPIFMLSTRTIVGITAATMPLSLLLSPITVPLLAIVSPIAVVTESTKGDVTPVYEDED